ncbi:MAG: CidA/LrgA family protein [Clostridiales bacterium]|nr:CidA/LrgA family protein [Clostridiales bacterium]
MKYIRQFLWILLITFLGEVLKYLIPLPIPASIYGLLLLLTGLLTGIIRLEAVKDASKFLIEIMPLMFIPAAVGLLDSWGALDGIVVQVLAATVISTVLVMGVSGIVTQMIIRREVRKEK